MFNVRRNNTLIRHASEGLKCHRLPTLLLLLSGLLLACQQAPQAELVRLAGPTMGTRYQVQIVHADAEQLAPALQRDIDGLLDGVEDMMSTYRPRSDLSRFNVAPADTWIEVPLPVVELVERARALSEASGGAFDVTVGPLVNLWGFGPAAQRDAVPEADLLAGARARVGFDKLDSRRQPPALRKRVPGLFVDLSAIAKGWGVDQVAELIAARGIRNYLVEIGGELRAAGRNARGEAWRVGVELPDAAGQIAESFVAIESAAVATSGDYRNYFTVDGRRYAHVLDPRSGWPADHALASVTVIADNCADADALATLLLVLGPQEGPAFARQRGLAALFLVRGEAGFSEVLTDPFQAYRIH